MTLCVGCESGKPDANALRSNFYEYPCSFDPRKVSDPISFTVIYMLFEGLVRLNRDGTLQFAQAEKIDLSDDQKIYTFHLGEHRWSNGKPVTAQDFAQSWLDILNPKFPAVSAHLLYPIKNAKEAKQGIVSLSDVGIRTVDDKTLQVELNYPTPYFLQLIANCSLFPINHAHEKIDSNWAQSDGENYICNGPFRLSKAVPNQEVIFVKNPQYRGKNKPKLKKIIFSILSDDMSALNLYASGGLDLISMPMTRFPLSYLKLLKERELLKSVSVAANLFCGFNTTSFPFHNANLRKAFSYAINRQEIVDHISQCGEEIATRAVPSILREGEVLNFFKDSDGKKASQLLEKGLGELGIEDLKDVVLLCYPHEITQRVALAISEQWKRVLEIDVKVQVIPFGTLMDKVHNEEYQIGLFAWMAEFYDPMSFFSLYAAKDDPKNYSRWENPEFSKLLTASSENQKAEDRKEILRSVEMLFVEEMPIAPIYHWKFPYLVKPYVKGFSISPLGQIYFDEVSIDSKNL